MAIRPQTTSESVAGVPTLHSMSSPILTKPEDVGAYLINMLFANPGYTSSVHEDEMISFRRLSAEYGRNPDALAEQISSRLTNSMNRYFPEADYSAICEVEKQDGVGDDGRLLGTHIIYITIADRDQKAIVPKSRFVVDANGDLTVKYGGRKV